ncbi:MAG: hypothetical protein Gyms2KO_25850 [Gymnodinialimonas sp.]
MPLWVEITEKVGKPRRTRQRDGAGAFALAHAVHAAQSHAKPCRISGAETSRNGARQSPPTALIQIGIPRLAPVAAAQAN